MIQSHASSLPAAREEASLAGRIRNSACGSLLAVLSACAPLAQPPLSGAAPSASCRNGAYQSPTGATLIVSRGRGGLFYYQMADGKYDWVDSKDSPVECTDGAVRVRDSAGAVETWPALAVRETPAEFVHDGITFHGLLVEPLNTTGLPPLLIMGHGSEESGALPRPGTINATQYLFAGLGVSSFIFDKRGTGRSGGRFVMNFPKLADDMVAASVEARRLAAGRFSRFGFLGPSQGGWIAPLAARNTGADFVVVTYGLAMSPHEEEREETIAELVRAGYGGQALADAGKVVDVLVTLMASGYEHGYEALAEVKRAYGTEAWFQQLASGSQAKLLNASEAELRALRDEPGLELDWSYDAMPVLRSSPVPLLWIIAAEDRVAPPEITLERLTVLRNEGKRIDVAVFPDTDHGMQEFIQAPDGTRTSTRITSGYFRLMGDWIHGRLAPPYGRATLQGNLRSAEGGR